MVGLAFFDVNLEPQLKAQMVRNMHENDGSVNPTHRLEAHLAQCNWADKELSSFVMTKTKLFFQNLCIPDSFLKTPVETWNDSECYTDAEGIVKSLKAVNDTAERGVKLIQDYNTMLTKDEEQKQSYRSIVGCTRIPRKVYCSCRVDR